MTEQPVLLARQLSLRTGRGWVYRDVDLALATGSVTALAGPAGSGRSMLLLTLAGRAKPGSGTLTVAGAGRRAEIRRRVAVARITGAVAPEPDLRVADHLAELRWLSRSAPDYRWAAEVIGLHVVGTTVVGELPPDDLALLALALAAAGKPDVLVLDDLDQLADAAQQRRIWAALSALAGHGIAGIASTRHPELVTGADVHTLPDPNAPEPVFGQHHGVDENEQHEEDTGDARV